MGVTVLAKQLFGLSPSDPITLASVGLALVAVGTIAGYLPARRAMAAVTGRRCTKHPNCHKNVTLIPANGGKA
jgi:hypothetical protein